MSLPDNSRYKTISAVLRKDQITRLTALKSLRSTRAKDAGFSEILREVVDEGLELLSRAPGSSFDTSTRETSEIAA